MESELDNNMKRNFLETLVGVLVLLFAAYFLHSAYSSTGNLQHDDDSYIISASFQKVDGINPGGDVKISGIKIGKIHSMELDTSNFHAVVKISLPNHLKIPDDSSATIVSNGLIGDKYISITAGASDEYLAEGDYIEFTQSSVIIEELIAKFMFGVKGDKKDQ